MVLGCESSCADDGKSETTRFAADDASDASDTGDASGDGGGTVDERFQELDKINERVLIAFILTWLVAMLCMVTTNTAEL